MFLQMSTSRRFAWYHVNHSTSPFYLDYPGYFPFCHLKYFFSNLGFHHKQLLHQWTLASQRRGSPRIAKQTADVQQRVLRAAQQQHAQHLAGFMPHTCVFVPELLKIRRFLLACCFAIVALEGVQPFEQLQSRHGWPLRITLTMRGCDPVLRACIVCAI